MKKITKTVLGLLSTVVLLQADQYVLVMSKDNNVCQHMGKLYNNDLSDKGKVILEDHEEYSSIKWDLETNIKGVGGKNLYKYAVSDLKISVFDINNDDKNEVILFTRTRPTNKRWAGESFNYYSYDVYSKIKTGIEIGDLYKLRLGDSLKERGGSYKLKELPIQKIDMVYNKKRERYAFLDSFMLIQPFLYKKTTYISLFGNYGNPTQTLEEKNMIAIRKYEPDNTLQDICYYIKTPTAKRKK